MGLGAWQVSSSLFVVDFGCLDVLEAILLMKSASNPSKFYSSSY
jgi:hypothetical protein